MFHFSIGNRFCSKCFHFMLISFFSQTFRSRFCALDRGIFHMSELCVSQANFLIYQIKEKQIFERFQRRKFIIESFSYSRIHSLMQTKQQCDERISQNLWNFKKTLCDWMLLNVMLKAIVSVALSNDFQNESTCWRDDRLASYPEWFTRHVPTSLTKLSP